MDAKKRWVLGSTLCVLALVSSACGSDDGGGDSDNGGASSSAALGPENKATGEPIKVAFITEGVGPNVDNTEEVESAHAALKYINEHLGGIQGRPLEFTFECQTKADPAAARECANQAVQSDAVALLTTPLSTQDDVTNVLKVSDLPVFTTGGGAAYATPGEFHLGNGLGGLIGIPAAYAEENGIKRVAVITVDVPAAVGPLTGLGKLAFGNAGAEMNLVPVPPGTADQSPQIQSALSQDPEMFHIIGDAAFCLSTLKAMRTLGVTQPIVVIPQCIGDADTAAQIPGGYKDLIVSGGYSLDPEDPDYDIYKAAVDTYTEGHVLGESAPTGFQTVLGFARGMTDLTGDVSRASVMAFLNAMPAPQKVPLYAGGTFQCGTKPLPLTPSICSSFALQGKSDEEGNVSGVEAVDVTDVFKAPGS
jgi:branched-chain amino acid transport system substrate-binding protein